MTVFSSLRITALSTHFSGVPRLHLEGKISGWETRGVFQPRSGPDTPPLDSEGRICQELSPPPPGKGSILISRALAPILWLWTWHFTLSWFPNPNPQAREITQHSTSQPWHDWHCGLDHSFKWDHPCIPGHLPTSPASTHKKPGASPAPVLTTPNLSKHCQISLFIAQSPWVENHLTEYKKMKKPFKILFQGDQLNKAWCSTQWNLLSM